MSSKGVFKKPHRHGLDLMKRDDGDKD